MSTSYDLSLRRRPRIGYVVCMRKPLLILVGLLFTGLAIAGAILPGLPTTPFLIVAIWAFARSSTRMTAWLERIPLLHSALREAHRFEQRRAVRPSVKVTAMCFAWGSAALTGVTTASVTSTLFIVVSLAAVAGTIFMIWIPTDSSPVELPQRAKSD